MCTHFSSPSILYTRGINSALAGALTPSEGLTGTLRKQEPRLDASLPKPPAIKVVAETVARDHTLSLAARGLYAYLSASGDGPRSADAIAETMRLAPDGQGGEGRRTVREAMAQLVTAGLVTRRKTKDGAGHWITEIHVESDSSGHTKPMEDNTDAFIPGVPHAGTSVPPAETSIFPVRTDVPASGMPVRTAQIHVLPVRADVPDVGTLSIRTANPATTVDLTQGQVLNVASMGGDQPTTNLVETADTYREAEESWPTVAAIGTSEPVPVTAAVGFGWADGPYDQER